MDVATRVEKAMSNIKNLRPSDFTLDKLDDELLCMAMICALPESFANLTSNLLLEKGPIEQDHLVIEEEEVVIKVAEVVVTTMGSK